MILMIVVIVPGNELSQSINWCHDAGKIEHDKTDFFYISGWRLLHPDSHFMTPLYMWFWKILPGSYSGLQHCQWLMLLCFMVIFPTMCHMRQTKNHLNPFVLFCCCCYLRSDSAIFWRDEVLLYKTPFEFKLWFTCKTSMNVFLVNHVIKWSSMLLCFKKILWIHN